MKTLLPVIKLFFVLFCCKVTVSSYAQASIFMQFPTGVATGDTVATQIRVADFKQVGSLQFSLNFQTSELEFLRVADSLPGMSIKTDRSNLTGQIPVSWFDITAQGYTLPDDSSILVLVFRIRLCHGRAVSIDITDVPLPRELGIITGGGQQVGILKTQNGGSTIATPPLVVVHLTTCNPTQAGTDTLRLQTMFGCDSLVVVTKRLAPHVITLLPPVSTCDPTQVGTDTLRLQTMFGCDSLVVVTKRLAPHVITLLPPVSTCDPTQAGTDTLRLHTTFGCDSLVVVTKQLAPHVITLLPPVSTCDPTQADTDTLWLQTMFGCDSLVVTTVISQMLTVFLDAEIHLVEGESVQLQPIIEPKGMMESVTWSPAEGLSCLECLLPWASPTHTTTYQITVAYEGGCTATAVQMVMVDKKKPIYFPNAINIGAIDERNGYFTVFSEDKVENIDLLQVYDRWGNLMFEGKDFPANEPHLGWDGTFRNKRAPVGVYVWYCKLRLFDHALVEYSGVLSVF